MMDSGIDLDLEAITQNIDEAEVITIYFPMLRKTLIIDTRSTDRIPAMVRLAPIARSSIDRFRSIRRLRPQFSRPDSITMIPWNRPVASLCELGVWPHVLGRVDDVARAEACLFKLRMLDHHEQLDAITGDHYQTLWPPRTEIEAD